MGSGPDNKVSGLDKTVAPAPTEPPTFRSGLDETVAPASPPAETAHEAKLTIIDPAHYEMLGEFARGGLGRIVRARDTRSGRLVAIKEMLGSSSDIARRFTREALLTANLQHPAIVPVYELGRWPNGEPFYAMKLVDGKSFEDKLATTKTLVDRLALLPTMLAMCEALAYAHGEAIIHRDLKPANVLVGAFGETVVIDWGLAKRFSEKDDDDEAFSHTVTPLPAQAAEGQTVAGSVMGTPAYMPPEQARGDDLDPRADVYALGAILYHLLGGTAPFADLRPKNVMELLDWAETRTPTPLAQLAPTAPRDLIAIVAKAMARDKSERYPTAKELAEDLRRFTTGQLVGAHRYDRWTLIKRWLRRNRAAVTVAAVLLVVLSVFAIVSVHRILAESARAEAESDRARKGLALALAQKGDAAERERKWARAAMYYQASLVHDDSSNVRFSAGRAEARTIPTSARHAGHRSWIHGLAITGTDAITVDETGEVRRWTLADGKLVASWKAPTPLFSVAVSPDGARVAVGGDDGVVRILDRSLVPRGEHRGHTQRVFSLAFSPDGHVLASGSADKSIRLVRLVDDRDSSTRVLSGHKQRVYSVAFSPNGKQLASASDDRTARVWNLESGESSVIDAHPRGGLKVAAWFPDGERLFTTGWDSMLKIWDTRSGKKSVDDPAWHDTGSVHTGVVAANGNLIVTGGDSAAARLWDPATRSLIAHLDGHVGQVTAIAVSSDARWLVSAGRDHVPRVWDLGAFRLARLGHRSVGRVAFPRDGNTMISSGQDNTIRLWDVATGDELSRISPPSECHVGATILGGEILGGCRDGNVHLWSLDGKRRRTLVGNTPDLRHAAGPADGSWIAAGHVGGWIQVWDGPTGKLIARREVHDHHVYGLRALPDGTILSSSLDSTVRRSSSTLEPIGLWRAPGIEGLLDSAMDPRGRFIVAGGDGSPLFKWDLTIPGAPVEALAGHTAAVYAVDVTSDGALVASASGDGTIRLWDTTTWTSRVLRGLYGSASAIAFSPDGRRLATGSRGAVILWDVAKSIPLRRFGASESGEQGSCDNLDAVAWNDPMEKTIILGACTEASGFARMSARTHLALENQVDLVEKW